MAGLHPGSRDAPEEAAVLGSSVDPSDDQGAERQALPLAQEPEPLVIDPRKPRQALAEAQAAAVQADPDLLPLEPGRALAIADFSPPQLSAGERLCQFSREARQDRAKNCLASHTWGWSSATTR